MPFFGLQITNKLKMKLYAIQGSCHMATVCYLRETNDHTQAIEDALVGCW